MVCEETVPSEISVLERVIVTGAVGIDFVVMVKPKFCGIGIGEIFDGDKPPPPPPTIIAGPIALASSCFTSSLTGLVSICLIIVPVFVSELVFIPEIVIPGTSCEVAVSAAIFGLVTTESVASSACKTKVDTKGTGIKIDPIRNIAKSDDIFILLFYYLENDLIPAYILYTNIHLKGSSTILKTIKVQ